MPDISVVEYGNNYRVTHCRSLTQDQVCNTVLNVLTLPLTLRTMRETLRTIKVGQPDTYATSRSAASMMLSGTPSFFNAAISLASLTEEN